MNIISLSECRDTRPSPAVHRPETPLAGGRTDVTQKRFFACNVDYIHTQCMCALNASSSPGQLGKTFESAKAYTEYVGACVTPLLARHSQRFSRNKPLIRRLRSTTRRPQSEEKGHASRLIFTHDKKSQSQNELKPSRGGGLEGARVMASKRNGSLCM